MRWQKLLSVGCSVTECGVKRVPCWPWKHFAGPPETYWKTRWTSDFCPSDADGTLNSSSQPHNILRQRETKNTKYNSKSKIINLHKVTGTLYCKKHCPSDETLNRGPYSLWSLKIPGCPSKKSRGVTPASWPNLPIGLWPSWPPNHPHILIGFITLSPLHL